MHQFSGQSSNPSNVDNCTLGPSKGEENSSSLRPLLATKRGGRIAGSQARLHFKLRSRPMEGGTRLRELKAQVKSLLARYSLTDPETGVAPGETGAAICVQNVDVQCVLQFTLIHAAGCVLHRHTSRVIHRLEFSFSRLLHSRKQLSVKAIPTTVKYMEKIKNEK